WPSLSGRTQTGWFPTNYVEAAVPARSSALVPTVAVPPPPPAAAGAAVQCSPRADTVRALYDYAAADDDELSLRRGDVVEVLESDGEWWKGRLRSKEGVFPANYVEWTGGGGDESSPGQLKSSTASPASSAAAAIVGVGSGGGRTVATAAAAIMAAKAVSDGAAVHVRSSSSSGGGGGGGNRFVPGTVAPPGSVALPSAGVASSGAAALAAPGNRNAAVRSGAAFATTAPGGAGGGWSGGSGGADDSAAAASAMASIAAAAQGSSFATSAGGYAGGGGGGGAPSASPVFATSAGIGALAGQFHRGARTGSGFRSIGGGGGSVFGTVSGYGGGGAGGTGGGSGSGTGPSFSNKPTWRFWAFVDLMADPFLRARSNDKPDVVSLTASLNFLQQVCARVASAAGTAPGGTTEALVRSHGAGSALLRDAAVLAPRVPVATGDDDALLGLLTRWVPTVRALREQEMAAVPAGWVRPDGTGHLVLLVVRRDPGAADAYSLSVVNPCGEGSEYHPCRADPVHGKVRRVAALLLRDVPGFRLRDSSWWALAFRPLCHARPGNGPALLYERLLPYLNQRALSANVPVGGGGGSSGDPVLEFRTPPRGGDASGARTAWEAVRHCHRLMGRTRAEAKRLALQLRLAMAAMARADLEHAPVLRGCDTAPLVLAARTLARRAGQAALLPDVPPPELEHALATARGLEAAAAAAYAGSWEVLPPAVELPAAGAAGAAGWPLAGRLRRDAGVDHLAGEQRPPPILRPVEMTIVPDSVSSFEDVSTALAKAVHCCTLLANQRELMRHTYFQRVSLLTHLFTRVMPLPMPNTHPEAAKRCFWQAADRQMRYDTQANILRQLDLLCRHFAAASLSLKITRSFDAVRMLTMSCLAAVADVVMRVKACDFPSQSSLHYNGAAAGPVYPFGFEMGWFAIESEWSQLVDPHLQSARCQVLDYFTQQRLALRDDHIVFGFEQAEQSMQFGPAEAQLIDQLCLQMGFPREEPWLYLSGENPILLDNYPELGSFRDIVYLLKAMMAPTSDALPEVRPWTPQDARLRWKWKGSDEGYHVKGFGGSTLECQAFVNVGEAEDPGAGKSGLFRRFARLLGGRKTRAPPSGANPSNLADKRIDTEDDVLFVQNLPDFGDRLRARDCELLLQFLTAPYLRIPLCMQFFADPVRMQALWSEDLQDVLDAALFEPGLWQAALEKQRPMAIPAPTREHLATPCGLLLNELLKSPGVLLASLEKMLDTAIELDTGKYSESMSPIILYVVRLCVRVEAYILFLHNDARCDRTRGLEASERPADALAVLAQAQGRIRRRLNGEAFPMLERWLQRAVRDKDTEQACVLHAHLLYLFKSVAADELNYAVCSVVISAQVWLMVHYRFGLEATDEDVKKGKAIMKRSQAADTISRSLQIPPTEVFEVLAALRNRVVDWLTLRREETDQVMEGVLRVITLTGDRRRPRGADTSFKNRHWESMTREHCRGRFVPDTEAVQAQLATQEGGRGGRDFPGTFEEWMRMVTQAVDTEINVQLGEFTLKRHSMETLPEHIEQHPDFVTVFGRSSDASSAVGCAEVVNTTRRTWLRLVGRRHDVRYWDADSRDAPPCPFRRDYVPPYGGVGAGGGGAAAGPEAWVAEVLEPVRQRYFPRVRLFIEDSSPAADKPFVVLAGYWTAPVAALAVDGANGAESGSSSGGSGSGMPA
ncbi:unnamed protein product, partial [Phaeothamnion confervicola]